jgi:DDE superfamily endonuclease
VTYEVPNKVGKMNTKVYTEHILPQILEDFKERGLTLCQDADSAHTSEVTKAWAEEHNLPILTLPGVSPDFSILESMAHPLKRLFHSKRSASEKGALSHFTQIFEKEMDQKTIQHMYEYYTKRLHDYRRAEGQMTKY